MRRGRAGPLRGRTGGSLAPGGVVGVGAFWVATITPPPGLPRPGHREPIRGPTVEIFGNAGLTAQARAGTLRPTVEGGEGVGEKCPPLRLAAFVSWQNTEGENRWSTEASAVLLMVTPIVWPFPPALGPAATNPSIASSPVFSTRLSEVRILRSTPLHRPASEWCPASNREADG